MNTAAAWINNWFVYLCNAWVPGPIRPIYDYVDVDATLPRYVNADRDAAIALGDQSFDNAESITMHSGHEIYIIRATELAFHHSRIHCDSEQFRFYFSSNKQNWIVSCMSNGNLKRPYLLSKTDHATNGKIYTKNTRIKRGIQILCSHYMQPFKMQIFSNLESRITICTYIFFMALACASCASEYSVS